MEVDEKLAEAFKLAKAGKSSYHNRLSQKDVDDLLEIWRVGRCRYVPTLAKLFECCESTIYRYLRLAGCHSTNTDV